MQRILLALLVTLSAVFVHAQAGPCTKEAIEKGGMPLAEDAFVYMPPFGKPVIGKSSVQETSGKKFAGRTNIKRSWGDDHRVVSSPSADMAYEYGTLTMSYDEDQKPHAFKAVILNVYKAKDGACQRAAGTMEPLEEEATK